MLNHVSLQHIYNLEKSECKWHSCLEGEKFKG